MITRLPHSMHDFADFEIRLSFRIPYHLMNLLCKRLGRSLVPIEKNEVRNSLAMGHGMLNL